MSRRRIPNRVKGQLVGLTMERMLEKIAAIVGVEVIVDEVGFKGNKNCVNFHCRGFLNIAVLMKLHANERRLFKKRRNPTLADRHILRPIG